MHAICHACRRIKLLEGINTFGKIEDNFTIDIYGSYRKTIKDKFLDKIEKNKNEGYTTIRSYCEVMSGKGNVCLDIKPLARGIVKEVCNRANHFLRT